jgi:cobalt-zinc-cadmium efflux system outer membrane protein
MRLTAELAIAAFLTIYSSPAGGQQTDRKVYTLRGTVEEVNAATQKVSIANEPISGGMGAMTMTYSVDKADLLAHLKPGDRITAKMREGETTLYEIAVVPQAGASEPATAKEMHLEDLERMALAGNPTLAEVQANVQAAAAQARQAGLYPNPTVGYYGDEIRGGYYGGGKQGGFISQTIVTGGKLGAARRVAELATREMETSGEAQRLSILNNVRALFYQVLTNQRLVEVRQNLVKLAADATQTSYQLSNVGQADRPDLLQAEVEQQQATISLRGAELGLTSLWRTLGAVVANPDLPQAHLEGDLEALPQLSYQEWLAVTLRDSPEVKLASERVARSEAMLVQAKKVPIPDLQIYGNLSQNNEPLKESSPRIAGLNGGVQMGVQIPIFDRNQGNIAAAKARIENSKQELARVRLQITREVAYSFHEYESALETARQYKTEMLPRAEQAYRLYRANYQNMAAAWAQVLISQRTLFQLEVDYVQALGSAWQSAITIRGFGLTDGLSGSFNTSSARPTDRRGGSVR